MLCALAVGLDLYAAKGHLTIGIAKAQPAIDAEAVTIWEECSRLSPLGMGRSKLISQSGGEYASKLRSRSP
jgi:hypothetical protein